MFWQGLLLQKLLYILAALTLASSEQFLSVIWDAVSGLEVLRMSAEQNITLNF